MRELGVINARIPADGTVTPKNVALSTLQGLKDLSAGKHEFRITALTVSVTVDTKLANDGVVAAQVQPKAWVPASVDAIMSSPRGAYRHVSAAPFAVVLPSPGEWTAMSNAGATIYLAGSGLAKETTVSLLVRGNVQFR
jgi:hypothetical protein